MTPARRQRRDTLAAKALHAPLAPVEAAELYALNAEADEDGDPPAPLPAEVEGRLRAAREGTGLFFGGRPLEAGQPVRVTSGPWAGQRARVVRPCAGRRQLYWIVFRAACASPATGVDRGDDVTVAVHRVHLEA